MPLDDAQAKELEFGDVLFSLVNVARKEDIDANGPACDVPQVP